ncbi:hypothetical protein Bhyg_06562, partial [Pseudolycoriella hygida]
MNTVTLSFVAVLMFVLIGSLEAVATVPLQRLRGVKTGDHFYTTSVAEAMAAAGSKAYVSEGVATRVSTSTTSECSLIPVYRYFNNRNDHFYTNNQAEGNGAAGYVSEGIAFYCAANENDCGATQAFYRYYFNSEHFYTTNVQEGFNVVGA